MKIRAFLFAAILALAHTAFAVDAGDLAGPIVVAAGSTIQAIAGTGSAISYHAYGTEVSTSGVKTYKELRDGGASAQLPTSTGAIYTAPSTAFANVSSITLTNATGSAVSGVKVFVGGSAAKDQILGTVTVPANGTCVLVGSHWSCIDATGSILTVLGGAAGGDLSGSFPNPTVLKTNGVAFGTLATQNGTFSGTSSGTNTGDVTLTGAGSSPNANAASLSGQQLQLQPANSSFPGLLSAAYSAFITAYKDSTIVLATANQYSSIACNGSTDDSAAWNTLFTNVPDRSTILIPPCTSVLVSGTNPSIPGGKHLSIVGAGIGKTIIESRNNAADFFTLNDWYNTFRGITFQGLNTTVTNAVALSGAGVSLLVGSTAGFPASGSFYVQTNLGWTLASYTSIADGTHFGGTTAAASTTVAGGPITVKTGGYAVNGGSMTHVYLAEVQFNYVFNGWLNNGTQCGIVDSSGFGVVNFDLQFNGANVNAIIHNYTTDGLPPAVAHIEVNQAGSLLISDSDIIRGQSDMRLNPTSPNGVFGVYSVNTYFDTATAVSGTANSGNGLLIQGTGNVQRIKLINSWFSGAAHDGIWSNSTSATLPTDLEISGNNIYSNAGNGIELTAIQDFIISDNQISGNTTAGISLTAGASAVTNGAIHHNQIGPAGGIGANGTGIVAAAGTYGNLSIDYNDLSGNTTAAQSGLPATVNAPNTAVVSHNLGLVTCPADESPATVLPLTTVTRAGSNPCVIRPGARVGSWVRITTTMTHLASSIATLSTVLKLGTANTNADATLFTPAALGAGTAVAGSCQDIYEFTVVSATTVNVSHQWRNGNNAATGCGGVSAINMATAPVTITSIASGGPYYLAPYYACTVASCETVQSVSYEYGQ